MSLILDPAAQPALEIEPYKSLDNQTLTERVQAVRTEMGPRLLILGHHYQQDEVIALSDLRGDSYQLSKLAAAEPGLPGDRLLRRAFHGRNGRHPRQPARAAGRARRPTRNRGGPARPGGRLLDGRHGRHRAGRGLLGATGRSDRRRGRDAGHLRQLGGQPEGVLRPARRHRLHVGQRPGGAPVVIRTAAAACCSSPISTWAATRP